MRRSLTIGLAVLISMFALRLSENASAANLTVDRCTKAYADMQKFIAYLKVNFANKSWGPAAAAEAIKVFNKLCPNFVPFTANTIYECGVLNSTAISVVALGVNA